MAIGLLARVGRSVMVAEGAGEKSSGSGSRAGERQRLGGGVEAGGWPLRGSMLTAIVFLVSSSRLAHCEICGTVHTRRAKGKERNPNRKHLNMYFMY